MNLQQQLNSKLDKRKYLYLFLDLEGTIIPKSDSQIVSRPRQQIIKALENLQREEKVFVNLISEHSTLYMKNLIQVKDFSYIGCLGGEISNNSHDLSVYKTEQYQRIFKGLESSFVHCFENLPGVEYKSNPFFISINFIQNHSPSVYHAINLWLKEIYPKIIRFRLMPIFLHNYRLILKPAKLTKLAAINKILEEKDLHKSVIIYVGDNFMDEEVFLMLKDKGMTVRIDNYPSKTKAHFRFRSDIELIRLLNMVQDFYN